MSATIDFEDPAYLSGASVVGQAGWALNSYVGPGKFLAVNGDVEVNASSPLSGNQSLTYQQTISPGGNGGGVDVSKADVITVTKNGDSSADVVASFLIQVDANSIRNGQAGVFFSFNGLNGNSPIGILLNDVNGTAGTGRIEPLDAGGFNVAAAQPYIGNDVLEFQFGINFDGLDYDISYRNVTAGGAFVKMIGSGAGGRFKFNGGAFPDDGDGLSYSIDVGTLFRGGYGQVDQITLTAVPEPNSVLLLTFCAAITVYGRRSLRQW
jgi:hypothetical protein